MYGGWVRECVKACVESVCAGRVKVCVESVYKESVVEGMCGGSVQRGV